MTSRDGIGRPRPTAVVERDNLIAETVAELCAEQEGQSHAGCRFSEIIERSGQPKNLVWHSLRRLVRDGTVSRLEGSYLYYVSH